MTRDYGNKEVKVVMNTVDNIFSEQVVGETTKNLIDRFAGAIADNFDEHIEQKMFHREIVVGNARVAAETKAYKPIPVITDFTDETGADKMKEQVQLNYNRIKEETKQIVADELERIKNDPALAHLLQQQE